MAFAGFNSSGTVKGRLQAALYFMRKKNRQRRMDADEPEPNPEQESPDGEAQDDAEAV